MPVETTRLTRTALLITGATILKTEPPAWGPMKRLYRWLMGGSLPFQNEVACYRANFDVFPNIDTSEVANLIMIRYEKPTGTATKADVTRDLVMCISKQIGALKGHVAFGPAKRAIFRMLNGPVQRTLRELAISKAFTVGEKLRLSTAILRLHIRNYRNVGAGRMIHNDLILHNILRFGEDFRPIDFEDSLVERVWSFVDLTDLMFQGMDWSREEIIEIIREVQAKQHATMCDAAIQDHFEFGFLRYHIRATVMSRLTRSERSQAAQLLGEWLNDCR